LGFADGYPYLLTNEASLRDLQQRCPAGVQMEQFRPNLVVSGVKTSAVHELHDERPAYGFDLRTKGTLPDFPWFSGELTYEQYYG
ncbi:inverse autotransporter beta domain-containing protein, partial [Salmonella enterica subsp. enterica serovar Virginia]|nr:inverse autotransporter beta domain-containing protein [Salmonella enterica subsp. enterica serovar Virginia]